MQFIPTKIANTKQGPIIFLEKEEGDQSFSNGHDFFANLGVQTIFHKIKQINNPVFLDVGGCVGAFTVALAKDIEARNGKVYTFEPQRILANCIAGSIALNGLQNTICINKAVGDPKREGEKIKVPKFNYTDPFSFGSIEFMPRPRGGRGGGTWNRWGPQKQQPSEESVELVSLDSYIDEFGKVDVIKMDVEGMEMQALEGAMELIKTFRPAVYIEVLKTPKKRVSDFFKKLNYVYHDRHLEGDRYNMWLEAE